MASPHPHPSPKPRPPQVEVASSESLLQILGRTERTTKATCQNEVSSRSHAILQLSVSVVPEHTWQQVIGLGLGLG